MARERSERNRPCRALARYHTRSMRLWKANVVPWMSIKLESGTTPTSAHDPLVDHGYSVRVERKYQSINLMRYYLDDSSHSLQMSCIGPERPQQNGCLSSLLSCSATLSASFTQTHQNNIPAGSKSFHRLIPLLNLSCYYSYDLTRKQLSRLSTSPSQSSSNRL